MQGAILVIGITCAASVGVGLWMSKARAHEEFPCLTRLRHRLAVYASAVLLWPCLLYWLLGGAPFRTPLSAGVSVAVMLYLSFEVSALSTYSGPLSAYESNDAVYERGVQVSTVAFAVATLLLSQKDNELINVITAPVLLALLFCTAAAVPSALARSRLGAAAQWNAVQKISVSFAAGLLCLSVARCLDTLRAR